MMKRLALPLTLLLIVSGAAVWWLLFRNNPQRTALDARELATWGLADHVARQSPGSRVLVVSNPFAQQPDVASEIKETEEAGIRGIRQGLGTQATLEAVVLPELRPEALKNPRALLQDADTSTPLSYLVAVDAFDRLAEQHPDCDVVISLVGLPAELAAVKIWSKPGPPKFALLLPDLRVIGNRAAVQRAVKGGKLAAFVLPKPGASDPHAAIGRNSAGEFEKRFVLVTMENIDQMMQSHPQLFPSK